jgi:hypothetical protein
MAGAGAERPPDKADGRAKPGHYLLGMVQWPPFLVLDFHGISRIFVPGKSWLPLATLPPVCFPIFPIGC